MYDVPCYGQVIEKHADSIKVQFYTRKKTTVSDYILKKKDTDDITEKRQGYLFYHLKQVFLSELKSELKSELNHLLSMYLGTY